MVESNNSHRLSANRFETMILYNVMKNRNQICNIIFRTETILLQNLVKTLKRINEKKIDDFV